MDIKKDMNDARTKDVARQKAFDHLSRAIQANCRFPSNVFSGTWSDFFFFDVDWIFDAQFVEKIIALSEVEGGQCACIVDLDVPLGSERSSFFIDKEITGLIYQSFLNGPSVGDGWLHGVDRFGCISDIGEWCIYCEKGNEIAVIGIRGNSSVEKYKLVLTKFKSLPIEEAIAQPLSYGFSDRALSPEWRNELLKQYAGGNRRGQNGVMS